MMMVSMMMNWSLDNFRWQMAHGWSVVASGHKLVRVSIGDGRSNGVAGWSSVVFVYWLLNNGLEWSVVIVMTVNSMSLLLNKSNLQNWTVQDLFDKWGLGNNGCIMGLDDWSLDNYRRQLFAFSVYRIKCKELSVKMQLLTRSSIVSQSNASIQG